MSQYPLIIESEYIRNLENAAVKYFKYSRNNISSKPGRDRWCVTNGGLLMISKEKKRRGNNKEVLYEMKEKRKENTDNNFWNEWKSLKGSITKDQEIYKKKIFNQSHFGGCGNRFQNLF